MDTPDSAVATALANARALHRSGKLRQALDAYEDVLRLVPGHADALFGSGIVLAGLGAGEAAAGQLEKARRAAPMRADIAFALAGALNDAGRPTASENAYRHAVALGGDSRGLTAFAHGMRQLGRFEEAEQALRSAIALDPSPAAWLALSDVLVDRYRIDAAVVACREAVALAPDSAAAHLRLGTRLLEAGQSDAARLAFRDALRCEPANTAAHYSLARITRHIEVDDRVRDLQALAAAPSAPSRQRADAHFALFKAFDDLDQTDAAFGHLSAANTLVRSQFRYSSVTDRGYFAHLQEVFDTLGPVPTPDAGAPGGGHIFVVGLPRSGSTLVEQILASHPLVHGAGEIQNLRREMLRGLERTGTPGGFPDATARLSDEAWRAVGAGYEASLEPSGRPVTVNKTPGNFQMVPAIWHALPNARIVHCHRSAMDTCFSIFRHNFVGWGFLYAYDQQEVAALHAIHDRFMDHWRMQRPDGLFALSYEALVANTEGVVRGLLDYCGLPWDDRCLAFADNPRAVRTASVEQVRRPINDRSVGSWRRYAAHLGPMRDRLRAEGLDAGDG